MDNSKSVLITGGTGMIGTRLTTLLLDRGYRVAHLTRGKKANGVPSFQWDIDRRFIDPAAFDGVDTLVHLAGASVGDKRWTANRRKEILESRTSSLRLLADSLARQKHSVQTIISASGVGYYGYSRDEVCTEMTAPGNDFLAIVCRHWEEETERFHKLDIRVVILRIGVVLSNKGGALQKLATPVKFFVGAPLGSGNQPVSWIHIDDLCGMFLKAITDNQVSGVYNAAAPNPVTNRDMTKMMANALHRPILMPPIPAFFLRALLGEMAEIVVQGTRVSPKKIIDAGYIFKFTRMADALADLLH